MADEVFTYDPSLPTPRDRMREAVGDTDPTNPLRYDATYDALLTYWQDEPTATAKLARALAVQYGRQASSVSVPGGPSVSYSDRVKTWLDVAKAIESVVPSASDSEPTYSASIASRPGMDAEPQREYRRGLEEWPGRPDYY